jgi:3-hydroxyisobutyrate dehydrogenase
MVMRKVDKFLELNTTNTVIGFIGTGLMGKSMAGHLLEAGYQLHVYSRSKIKS